ncbi:MAG: acetyl ornithine aminotransferase family protein [Candidatus Aminicenantes bacterium]|nr:acetyl ornithine aminotransferase family protein [Candidatus Aminicenantes bacterium]
MTISAPLIKTELPGKKAKEIIARDSHYASNSYIKEYPLVIARGEGAVVEDVDGNRFLDAMAGIAVNVTGYSHPKVVRAVQEQVGKFFHICSTDFYYSSFAELMERLACLTPISDDKKVFMTNSGAEAVETAIKLARYHTDRNNLIAFLGAFHGRTIGALSLTASKAKQRSYFGPFLPGIYHVPYGYCYRCPYNLSYDSCGVYCADAIEKTLCKFLMSPEDIAAVIVEPILGEGGYVVPPMEFHQKLRKFTAENGILYIADEIQSGMGRTGKFLALEHFHVEPDVVLLAKGLASGLPLGAVIARERLMRWESGTHGSTFAGNPVSCEASLATLDLIEEELISNASKMGDRLLSKLKALKDRHSLIGDVRGIGLMVGVELVKDRKSKEPAVEEVHTIVSEAFQKGLLLLSCGDSVIRFCPPLVINSDQIDRIVEIFSELLSTYDKRR